MPVKPVILSVPSLVSIPVDGVVLKPFSCVTVKIVPPMVTVAKPSGAVRVIVPVVVSDVSPTVVSPASLTVACPASALLPSTAVMVGALSVVPLIVIVNVAVLVSPSASVILYVKVSARETPVFNALTSAFASSKS